MQSLTLSISATTVALAACASTPGAQPQDMSAAQHEAMARRDEQTSTTHLTQYDPNATKRSDDRCDSDDPCWTTTDPNAGHQMAAADYKKSAAFHRAASQALRNAEAQACGGLRDEDRDTSPFAHRKDIVSVDALRAPSGPKGNVAIVEGAVITFRAVPGMTQQWLQRLVDCHIARNTAMGHDAPEMAFCPLSPKGVSATASATHDGFAIAVRSNDEVSANEIVRRAQALTASRWR